MDKFFIWTDHVLLFSMEDDRRYFTISYIFESGLDHTEKNRAKISLWIFASIGSSPVKKWMAGVDACLLSCNTPFRDFLWKTLRGEREVLFKTNEDIPDRRTGQSNVP